MSFIGRLGHRSRGQEQCDPNWREKLEHVEAVHNALFVEASRLREVGKFILNGHTNHIIRNGDEVYNITCIAGNTTRIKITNGTTIEDYSISDCFVGVQSQAIDVTDGVERRLLSSFTHQKHSRQGFNMGTMTEKTEQLVNLQERLLIAGEYIDNQPYMSIGQLALEGAVA